LKLNLSNLLTPKWAVAATTVLLSALLLFVRLGHYALWDDESYTALAARGVLATGDTTAVIGHNIVAFRNGLLLRNLCDRATPPLPSYLAAAFMGMLGDNAFVARLPFALCGLATIVVLLRWAWRDSPDFRTMLILGIAILGNVSFMLYCRQCRYYGASLFLTVAIVYLYAHFDGKPKTIVLLTITSMLLLPTNYIHYVAMYLALGIDYVIWGRHRWRMSWQRWACVLGPQVVFGLIIASIWNPLRAGSGDYADPGAKGPIQWIEMIWLFLRDTNRNEFGPMILLILAPILYYWKRNDWLLRAPLAAIPFFVAAAVFIPPVLPKGVPISDIPGDIRYVVPIIPLYFGLTTLTLCLICGKKRWLAVGLAVPFFLSNLLCQIPRMDPHLHVTLLSYIGELHNPPPDPFTPTAQWINEHVEDGQSIWVLPDFMTYPLMYHAPKAVYAWQIKDPPAPQFEHLPDIHFFGRVLPDYIVVFGPTVIDLQTKFHPPEGITYQSAAILDVFWKDLYRPELFWRSFDPMPVDIPHGTGIYIFKKHIAAPEPPPPPPAKSDFHI
jgi:hypothetical protein